MLDLTAFAQTTNQRFVESTRAGGIKNPRLAKLGNRREPFRADSEGQVPNMGSFVPLNNSDAELLFVRAFAVPALGFFATWDSGASFVLTRWQFGESDWVK